ncbi:MAG: helix-turn-helix domain-containing protein [Prevotellaceae bacterium]|jgi:AraC-like DNA-binding protein|nr:helix-turn-helix domain-containing protein [Prevotellaceae bacterium]
MKKEKNTILPFNWQAEINVSEMCSIGNDFILVDTPFRLSAFDYPFKLDSNCMMISTRGSAKGTVNLKPYTAEAPCVVTLLAEQILEYQTFSVSDDFAGFFIVMSNEFFKSLNIHDLPLHLAFRDNPYLSLTTEEAETMTIYYTLLKRAISNRQNPHRMDMARCLTLAIFYGLNHYFQALPKEENKTRQRIIVKSYLDLVQANYKEHRDVAFYADKLRLTSKHLSKVMKKYSGKSAAEWIDDYVILEAKALLKSTNMTIQQISEEELNFPSQSFLRKVFQAGGRGSPKENKRK